MTEQIIIGIIVFIATSVLGLMASVAFSKRKIIMILNAAYIFTVVRYMAVILAITLCWLLIPLNKWFVLSCCVGCAFMVLMIVYDYFLFVFVKVAKKGEKETLEKEIDDLIDQMGDIDRHDKVRRNEIKNRIKVLRQKP